MTWATGRFELTRSSGCIGSCWTFRAACGPPSLDEFTGFLVRLLADPNFKISLTTLQIWDALLVKVGADARTVIPSVVPTLVRKLGDGKSVVREANMTSLGGLFRALPGETIDAIFSTFKSSDLGKGVSAARVKEDALCAVIRAILDKDRSVPGRCTQPSSSATSSPPPKPAARAETETR